MIVDKKQKSYDRFRFEWRHYASAREGFLDVLQSMSMEKKKILLPAYIGFSTREGSGVFDPVRVSETTFDFYHMTRGLNIDLYNIKRKIKENQGHILLLIHYFGFKDSNILEIKEYARQNHMVIIEDFAHSFFTFWVDPVLDFDYAFFSIHKLFPQDIGGLVLTKNNEKKLSGGNLQSPIDLFSYDMLGIIKQRIENFQTIKSRIKSIKDIKNIAILRTELNGQVPQTFPILLDSKHTRDKLYFKMNEDGYGVVSLYHTLIHQIDPSFSIEHDIADRILNLPVHQDAGKKELETLVDHIFEILN